MHQRIVRFIVGAAAPHGRLALPAGPDLAGTEVTMNEGTTKIWAHSGDSHFLEPDDLWFQILPAKQAERMPRSEKVGENEEIVHVDGKSFRRTLPKVMTVGVPVARR